MLPQLSPVLLASVLRLVPLSLAQSPPPVSYDNVTVLASPAHPNITISFKTPDPGTCTTAFPTQKQYSGYIRIPPSTLESYQQTYPINAFFWFFEARQNPETAPLTIWLNGGPGSSSMIGLFQESGPCEVVRMADGSYGTQARMWGWDRSSNIVYIDQPAQVGFSYDQAVNASLNLMTGQYTDPPAAVPSGVPPYAFLNGTFPTRNVHNTSNTTQIAASATWHFLQTFIAAFPQYNPGTRNNASDVSKAGVNLFTESYGGQYGPAFADYFEKQNTRRAAGQLSGSLDVALSSVGIINGLVDDLIQAPIYPTFAYNNTYGIQAIDQTTELNTLNDFHQNGGGVDLIQQCRNSSTALDPEGAGDNAQTNRICRLAEGAFNEMQGVMSRYSNKSYYDIRVNNPTDFPSPAYLEYLNTAAVQRSIGAQVNYTDASPAVFAAFAMTGDSARGAQIPALADLLARGVRVALMYGDADYICNWVGGEAISQAVASSAPAYASAFTAAGYAEIVTNSSYVGGEVRQFANLSFSRIYDSGHLVPAYQPETAFTVFTRVIDGTDIGLGSPISLQTFYTRGPPTSNHTNKTPSQLNPDCWLRDVPNTCSPNQVNFIQSGKGVVLNGVWFSKASDYDPPSSSVLAGIPGSLPSTTATSSTASSSQLTGVYTATGTPKVKSEASMMRRSHRQLANRSDQQGSGFMPDLAKLLPSSVNVLPSIRVLLPVGLASLLSAIAFL